MIRCSKESKSFTKFQFSFSFFFSNFSGYDFYVVINRLINNNQDRSNQISIVNTNSTVSDGNRHERSKSENYGMNFSFYIRFLFG